MPDVKQFRNLHIGERAFIACTGTSLASVDGSLLKDCTVFGMNRGYLKEDLNYRYFCVSDMLIADQFHAEIAQTPCDALFCSGGIADKNYFEDPVIWHGTAGRVLFQSNFENRVYGGGTVTYVIMQLAFYMGFTEVYLLGCDHYYDYDDAALDDGEYVSGGHDPNHFMQQYIPLGYKYNASRNISKIEQSYRLAALTYGYNGRILANASAFSALSEDIIPRVDLLEVL